MSASHRHSAVLSSPQMDLFNDFGDDGMGWDEPSSSANNAVFVRNLPPKPPDERPWHNMVGFENHGATCYLNSLVTLPLTCDGTACPTLNRTSVLSAAPDSVHDA